MKVDVLYLAWNRLDFTGTTFPLLRKNTDWSMVSKLVVYDDGSEDGTQEYLRDRIAEIANVDAELRVSDLRSPPAVMNHYLATSEADLFAKIDNDIAVPPGWLEALISVMEKHPELELLGTEAGFIELAGRDGKPWDGTYDYTPGSHMGGVGLMRVSAFRSRPALPTRGRYGFTEWQTRYEPVRGWITPDLLIPQLDRVPVQPFMRQAEEHIENGWSRPWGKYDERWMTPYYDWLLRA